MFTNTLRSRKILKKEERNSLWAQNQFFILRCYSIFLLSFCCWGRSFFSYDNPLSIASFGHDKLASIYHFCGHFWFQVLECANANSIWNFMDNYSNLLLFNGVDIFRRRSDSFHSGPNSKNNKADIRCFIKL